MRPLVAIFIYLSICLSPCPYAVCLNSSNKRQGPCIEELLVQWKTVWFLFMFCYRCAQRCYGNTTKGHLFLPRGVLRRLPEVEFRNFHRRWERMREKMVRNSKIWGIWIFLIDIYLVTLSQIKTCTWKPLLDIILESWGYYYPSLPGYLYGGPSPNLSGMIFFLPVSVTEVRGTKPFYLVSCSMNNPPLWCP